MTLTEIAQQDGTIQILSLLILLEIFCSESFQAIVTDNKMARGFIIAIGSGVLHNIIFYVVLTIDRYTNADIHPFFGSYTVWSAVRVFHLFAMMGVVDFMRGRIAWFGFKKKHPEGFIRFLLRRIHYVK